MSTIKSMSDEALALAYIDGNNRAFDELLERSQDKIFHYILYMVKDEDLANELFQETFLKVVVKMKSGKYTDNGKFQWWLTRITHNVIIDYFRDQKNRKIVDAPKDNNLARLADTSLQGVDDRETELVNEQILRDVKRLIDYLPDTQRDVVHMRFFENLTFKEIAQLTGVSINTSLGRMRYALMNLRKISKEHNVILTAE